MKYFILALLLLSGCTPAEMIGQKKIITQFHCMKERSDLGFTSGGHAVVTSSCEVSRCARVEVTIGKYIFSNTTRVLEIVNDNLCLEK